MAPITIRKQIQINAPIETVWQFVGTPEGLRRWWETEIQFEAREGVRHALAGTVTRYDPPHAIGFSLRTRSTDGGADREQEGRSHADPDTHALPSHSTVSIQLEPVGAGTTVKIAHQIEGALVDAMTADAAAPVMALNTSGSPYMSLHTHPAPSPCGVQRTNMGVILWQVSFVDCPPLLDIIYDALITSHCPKLPFSKGQHFRCMVRCTYTKMGALVLTILHPSSRTTHHDSFDNFLV